jgi:hypothetical protein
MIPTKVSAAEDWQYWNALNIKKTVNEKIDLFISLTGRFNNDMHHFFYGGVQIGPVFKINKNLEISPSYFWLQSESKGHFYVENRPMLDVNLKWKMRIFKFTHRSRLEYRSLMTLSRWRYRDLIKVGVPFTLCKHSIMPYVSGEIFYEERKDKFNQSRFSVGCSINLIKGIDFDLYYLKRSDRVNNREEWPGTNVFGTALTLSF